MASVLNHIETVNIKFLNVIVWSIEVGDNFRDMLDTKVKAKYITQRITITDIDHILQLVVCYAGWKICYDI